MSRIIFSPDNSGDAVAYIKALTGAQVVVVPDPPDNSKLGAVLKVESKLLSVSGSADIGFAFAAGQANMTARVLVQDYWFFASVPGAIPEVNSWTFATGFRVGLMTNDSKIDFSLGLGMLAAKAQVQQANLQIHILRVGMPYGPDVPAGLAMPTALDVEKYGALKSWEESIIAYHKEHRADETPMLVSASINISGERLVNDAPGVRFAMWRIVAGQTLRQSIGLLTAGKAPTVDEGQVRAVYASVFGNNAMIVPGNPAEQTPVQDGQKRAAADWLNSFKNL